MLTNQHIFHILREAALFSRHDFNLEELRHVESNQRTYPNELDEFKRDLSEAGNKIRILLMEYSLDKEHFTGFLSRQQNPVLLFTNEIDPRPIFISLQGKKFYKQYVSEKGGEEKTVIEESELNVLISEKNEILFYAIFTYANPLGQTEEGQSISPLRRLWQLLNTEKKEILYILFYALIIGLVSLVLPLGIQTTVELVSGGVIFSSVYLMIGLVILGVVITGALQIVQISLVEFLQRRVFAKAAFEFAFRIPRLKLENIQKSYTPELVNRFFDILTIQKGLPKLLIDLSSSVIQILFGLVLISLYHPFFVFFGLVLLAILFLIFYTTGPRGLASSISESKYKYKVAQWLEELARALQSFKMAGNTDLPTRRTDYSVNNYIKNRKIHFNTLVTQFSFIIFFKAMITGGLLIMGTMLVVDRQITLGQFVAAEVIIILILNAVEKIIMYMDVVYDLLTAVDKVSHVTDLPIEKTGGFDLPKKEGGFDIRVRNVSYYYADAKTPALKNISLDIKAGDSVCISGGENAGKTTLSNILAGFYHDYEGVVTYNQYALRDLDVTQLRNQVAKNISQEDLFDGTILENLTFNRAGSSIEEVHKVLNQVGLLEAVQSMPEGLNTHLISGGKGLTRTFIQKLILARCILKKPKLILLHDFFLALPTSERKGLVDLLFKKNNEYTVIVFSNDPMIMSACSQVIVFEKGSIKANGSFDELLKSGAFTEII